MGGGRGGREGGASVFARSFQLENPIAELGRSIVNIDGWALTAGAWCEIVYATCICIWQTTVGSGVAEELYEAIFALGVGEIRRDRSRVIGIVAFPF